MGVEEELGVAVGSGQLSGHARQDGDGELQALGAVDGQDADGIVVDLGKHGLGDPAVVVGQGQAPVDEAPQRPTSRFVEEAGPIGQEPDPSPGVAGPGLAERHLEDSPVADEAFQHPGGAEVVAEAVDRSQPGQPVGDHGHRRVADGLSGLVVPRAAVVDPPAGQVVVSAAEIGGP